MQRNMDLIRDLMLRLEEIPLRAGLRMSISAHDDRMRIAASSPDEVAYHLDQIEQSGFVNDGGVRPAVGIGFAGLTPAGHDFLDAVREPKVCVEMKIRAQKIGGFTISILRDIAVVLVKGDATEYGISMG